MIPRLPVIASAMRNAMSLASDPVQVMIAVDSGSSKVAVSRSPKRKRLAIAVRATPQEAQTRLGFDTPRDAHRELRAKQHARVFGQGIAPSDEIWLADYDERSFDWRDWRDQFRQQHAGLQAACRAHPTDTYQDDDDAL